MKRITLLTIAVFTLIAISCKKESNDTPKTFTLTYSAGPGGTVTGLLSQQVEIGESGTEVVAVANEGKAFTSWSDGNTNPNRTDTDVQGDISVVANFGHPLYVAVNGNDAVTYEENSIDKPWATPNRAWEMAQAGDVVYFRGGMYTLTTKVNTQNTGYHGTAENPITFTNYPNEMATFDCKNVIEAFSIQKDYNTVTGMTFINYAICFQLGYNVSGHHAVFTNNTGVSNRDGGIEQHGFVCSRQGEYFTVEHNKFSSPPEFINTPAIMIFARKNYTIRHNEFYNLPKGIYHKHPNNVGERESINVEIAFNYFKDCLHGLNNTGHAAKIHDNIFDNSSLVMGQSGGSQAGYSLSDFNVIENNTFYFKGPITTGEDPSLHFSDNLSDPDPYPGCTNNIIRNNIFTASIYPHLYAPSGTVFNNTYNYNLYHNNSERAIVQESRVNYNTLAEWQTKNGTDQNSLRGNPIFMGGANPTTIGGFALSTGSPGKGVGVDGKDIGANVSKVGILYTTTNKHP